MVQVEIKQWDGKISMKPKNMMSSDPTVEPITPGIPKDKPRTLDPICANCGIYISDHSLLKAKHCLKVLRKKYKIGMLEIQICREGGELI